MAKSVKRAPKAKKVQPDEQVPQPPAGEVVVAAAVPDAGKKAKPRCQRQVEVRIKVPGYVPYAARVVDIDRLDAAERAQLLDDLVDQLVELLK